MAQIRQVVSESLQATIRRLLPSQQGFTEDLQATNVITPIIDLTPTAEGSNVPQNLQTAWDSSTGSVQITTTTYTSIVANTGFWQVGVNLAQFVNSGTRTVSIIQIDDGSTTTNIWASPAVNSSGTSTGSTVSGNFVVFLRAGDTLQGKVGTTFETMDIWYRQIADVNGNLVNPTGFTPS